MRCTVANDPTSAWAFVSALSAGGLAAGITKWFDRRKTEADVASTVQATYSSLVSDLRNQLQVEREVMRAALVEPEEKCEQRLRATEERLRRRITTLEAEVRRLGGNP